MAHKHKTYDSTYDCDEGIDIPDETVWNDALRREDDYYESLAGPEWSDACDEGYIEEGERIETRASAMNKAKNRIPDDWPIQNVDDDRDIENEHHRFSSSSSISSLSSDNSLSIGESSDDDGVKRKKITMKQIAARQAALDARRERERCARWKRAEDRAKAVVGIRKSDLGFAKYRPKTSPAHKDPVPPPKEEKESEWNEEWITEKPASLKGLRILAWDSMGRHPRLHGPPRPSGPRQR